MENKLHNTFDKIHAESALKEKTAVYLRNEMQKRSRPVRTLGMRLAVVCASLAAVLSLGGFSYNLYFTESAYVDMDVNPSIALTLNRFDRVLDAAPYNDDGAAILQNMDVRHQSCEQAVESLLTEMIRQGYLKTDGLVTVTIQTDSDHAQQKMLGEIQESIDSLLVSQNAEALTDVFPVSGEVRDCAHDYNLSPAKYLAITQLQEVDPGASYEQCAEHSISEIRQLTEEHCNGHHEEAATEEEEDTAETPEDMEPAGEKHHGHEEKKHH